jgi:hypothetical protein
LVLSCNKKGHLPAKNWIRADVSLILPKANQYKNQLAVSPDRSDEWLRPQPGREKHDQHEHNRYGKKKAKPTERSTAKPMDCVVSGNAWPEL